MIALGVALAAPVGARAADPPRVLISQFATSTPEFVDLVNVSSQAVDLTNWTVASSANCLTTLVATLPTFALQPGEHYLLAHSADAGTFAIPFGADSFTLPPPDFDLSGELVDFVPSTSGVLILAANGGQEVDRVGYGAINPPCAEGTPVNPAPGAGQSSERLDGGHQDTQNNAADFALQTTPSPKNSTTTDPGFAPPPPPPPPPPPAPPVTGAKVLSTLLRPAAPSVGQTVTLKIRAQDAGFAMDGITVDTGDSGREIGASSCEVKRVSSLFTPGRVATYTLTFTFSTPGTHHLTYSVLSGGCTGSRVTQGSIDVTVAPSARAASLPLAAKARKCKNANIVIGPTNLQPAAKAIICLLNIQRAKKHLRGLINNTRLGDGALFAANDMVKRRFFAHVGPGGPGVVQRLRRVGYHAPTIGENIGLADVASPQAMVSAWMASPPHRANILYKGFRFIGIGIVLEKPTGAPTPGDTFVTDFGSGPR